MCVLHSSSLPSSCDRSLSNSDHIMELATCTGSRMMPYPKNLGPVHSARGHGICQSRFSKPKRRALLLKQVRPIAICKTEKDGERSTAIHLTTLRSSPLIYLITGLVQRQIEMVSKVLVAVAILLSAALLAEAQGTCLAEVLHRLFSEALFVVAWNGFCVLLLVETTQHVVATSALTPPVHTNTRDCACDF